MLASGSSHSDSSDSLIEKLAIALPKDVQFNIHHVSSYPTRCAAIYATPPGSKTEKTYCESHFLTVSRTPSSTTDEVFIYAIEVLIYSTEHLTTLFVSKADSTGYIHLIETPAVVPSLLKTISSTLISHLVETRQRAGIKLVVSLFARAQDQYLFPGSIENSGKHVLDDRGLVRWWCKVLDPVLRQHPAEEEYKGGDDGWDIVVSTRAKAYLIVPGCDKYETSSFFPPSSKADPPDRKRWSNAHPLRQIATNPSGRPRCLIPHFPDDPKARFLDELDDELPDAQESQNINNQSKRYNNGQWKSVRTLEQFWELMAFRQECSSGRLVGFLWVVFTPPETLSRRDGQMSGESQASMFPDLSDLAMLPTPLQSQQQDPLSFPPQTPEHSSYADPLPLSPRTSSPIQPQSATKPLPQLSFLQSQPKRRPKKRPLTGPIVTRKPRIKGASSRSSSSTQPEKTKHYSWPKSSRGQVVLSEKDYKRAMDLLLRLDFADQKVAASSTTRWVNEVAVIAGMRNWGQLVVGKKEPFAEAFVTNKVNTLNNSTVKKKRKSNDTDGQCTTPSNDGVTMLSTELMRKKPKTADVEKGQGTLSSSINILGSGLVRKKPKTADV
ncbi:MAG: hypothetical protein M1830_002584 [Pleopsidium flavum]|nr:MAG: hypothetical protein M1830_002584 [Pleopsidium flavum]